MIEPVAASAEAVVAVVWPALAPAGVACAPPTRRRASVRPLSASLTVRWPPPGPDWGKEGLDGGGVKAT